MRERGAAKMPAQHGVCASCQQGGSIFRMNLSKPSLSLLHEVKGVQMSDRAVPKSLEA